MCASTINLVVYTSLGVVVVVVMQPLAAQPAPPLETWCIYVQRQFNTLIVLVAKAGLHDNHSLLTQLVYTLYILPWAGKIGTVVIVTKKANGGK